MLVLTAEAAAAAETGFRREAALKRLERQMFCRMERLAVTPQSVLEY